MPTGISYADEVWNVCIGCTKIKSGCTFCWAERLHTQRHVAYAKGKHLPAQYAKPFSEIQLLPDRLEQPLHWRKPRTIFVNSMGDTWHKDVPFEFIMQIFNIIEQCPQHTFLLFTKRWVRAYEFYGGESGTGLDAPAILNVHLYFSVSTQAEVDEAVPILLQIPVAVRGLSLEPLLGGVDLQPEQHHSDCLFKQTRIVDDCNCDGGCENGQPWIDRLDSVIVGCESGPKRRLCSWGWIESIVNQCSEAGVDCYVKQIEIDGKVCGDPKKFPENLRVRSMPK